MRSDTHREYPLSGEALFQICVRCDAGTFEKLVSTPLWFDIRRFAGDNFFWFLRVQARRHERLYWRPEISWKQVETVILSPSEHPSPFAFEFVRRFCSKKRKPTSKDSLLIRVCCARGASTLVRELLGSQHIYPVVWSHLSNAALMGRHASTIEVLLEGLHPTTQDISECLRDACAHGYTEIIELLVRDGRCDLNGMEGRLTGIAEQKGSEKLRQLLSERGMIAWDPSPGPFLIALLLLWLLLTAL